MDEAGELRQLVKRVTVEALNDLCDAGDAIARDHTFSESIPREMKAAADRLLEDRILRDLEPTGLPILSEECGERSTDPNAEFRFVVDPLDGTVNFIRGLGSCAISIALCRGNQPVFGAVGIYPERSLAWGGKGVGAALNDRPIGVSSIDDENRAVICTGFPSRFRIGENDRSKRFVDSLNRYGKVRMLGSAAVSLVKVAAGAAEIYAENEIMIWDVAAGMAIVEGAGGAVNATSGSFPDSLYVVASNGVVECPRGKQ
ncbi:MAG: inositol monophosphatase [Proteobacteria bacterium]|nr:MAG: inositol monophosphatase [Pseudomonadota bacterium]